MANKTDYAYLQNLLNHKELVGRFLVKFVSRLFYRAVVHDASKFSPAEFGPYAAQLPAYERAIYGTPEYDACMEAIKPAIEHHFAVNTHHPEYYPHGIADMDLFDLVEMVCDWIAASQRTPGSTLRLDLQRERFHIDEPLYGILCRTAHELAPDIEIQE